MTQLGYGVQDTITMPSAGAVIGAAATDKVGFYGAVAVTQRSGTIQGTAACAASVLSVSTTLATWAAEVRSTLVGLGLWAGG